VTVAAIVERDGRYLLVEEQTAEGLKLNNPAGHLNPGESPLQGVVREVLEETACAFEPVALVGIYLSRAARAECGVDVTYLRFAFAGHVGGAEPGRKLDEGIVRTLWLSADELRRQPHRHRTPLLMRCIDDHARGRRFALDLIGVDASVYAGRVDLGGR